MNNVRITNLRKPTVHLNGTSRSELREQLEAADDALRIAIDRLIAASPNARDYYPQGSGAFDEADDQHRNRVQRLISVREELTVLIQHVVGQ